ncbi:tRNA (5-methylaminomethyl-2-thiouridylate)-methyltransferase [Entomoplasma freundtii]|uniref:tRNA-specific 2-thiouridylase MnmA n=1 Tax=Entomoplasma freundtii TaxID=74700 RepID=A0A2K8NUG0_9MOLU|nr:tRNA 2-thiouridine(34) synthase MnmA [Entomoplasma freundtii]ATZ16401.1 tRNA 2-thiouridine(34) synthase MnmA [Entomoplasma freundtii]TDY56560.1 tRNA (5-methylaminomethyl-2-thiouridylate)-methyltransferase [Entomoplasma freundtii]
MKKEKVVVGLSGGVDSSVVALLLLEQGYEVEGLFMRNWDATANNDFLGNKTLNDSICPQEQDFLDAQAVADKLGIKLHRVDFVQDYWDDVFSYFIKEHQLGRTPNPDILCNKYIKFDKFLHYALNQLKADKIAMGHYAGVRFNTKTKSYELLEASDKNKDQTYFLSQLTSDQLAKTLFPLAKLTKPEIRQLAKLNHLATAEKKDSTGICFIGERNFKDFLQNYLPHQPGKIVDIETGEVLGTHVGVMYYTIGQRKGLNLGGQLEPHYVAKKDIDKKTLYVAKASDESHLLSSGLIMNEVNWISNLSYYFANPNYFEAEARFRYRQPLSKVRVQKLSNNGNDVTNGKNAEWKVTFSQPLKAITEGQAAVFYHDGVCLGGGTITKVFASPKNNL